MSKVLRGIAIAIPFLFNVGQKCHAKERQETHQTSGDSFFWVTQFITFTSLFNDFYLWI
jgi:hypothetical protein